MKDAPYQRATKGEQGRGRQPPAGAGGVPLSCGAGGACAISF